MLASTKESDPDLVSLPARPKSEPASEAEAEKVARFLANEVKATLILELGFSPEQPARVLEKMAPVRSAVVEELTRSEKPTQPKK